MSMRVTIVSLAAVTLACASASGATKASAPKPAATVAAPSAKFPVVVKSKDGSVEAHFDGETPPADLKAPLQFGTSRLWFTFAGDKTAREFKPKEALEFSDWFFDIFSPDGKWVLLPQGHYGPYHVVATSDLKDYLAGKKPPAKVLQEATGGTQQALVHMDARWVANDEVEYKVGGETPEARHAKVP
jgi:hypothetical protein